MNKRECEDAISRQAVLAIAGDSCLDLDDYEDTKEFCDEINELPPVKPTRKKGKWEDIHDKEEWYGDQFKCSVCGWVTLDNGKYCPNCGAKMGSEEE